MVVRHASKSCRFVPLPGVRSVARSARTFVESPRTLSRLAFSTQFNKSAQPVDPAGKALSSVCPSSRLPSASRQLGSLTVVSRLEIRLSRFGCGACRSSVRSAKVSWSPMVRDVAFGLARAFATADSKPAIFLPTVAHTQLPAILFRLQLLVVALNWPAQTPCKVFRICTQLSSCAATVVISGKANSP
jgi:hypothetical protein